MGRVVTRFLFLGETGAFLQAFETFVCPVTTEERAAYYTGSKPLARLFGITEVVLPESYGAFRRYYERTCRELIVGRDAREISRAVFAARLGPVPVSPLAPVLAAGLLPDAVRTGYGLRWGWDTKLIFHVTRYVVRLSLPVVPAGFRYWQHARIGRQ